MPVWCKHSNNTMCVLHNPTGLSSYTLYIITVLKSDCFTLYVSLYCLLYVCIEYRLEAEFGILSSTGVKRATYKGPGTHATYRLSVQERRNSSALAMELRLSCANPLIYRYHYAWYPLFALLYLKFLLVICYYKRNGTVTFWVLNLSEPIALLGKRLICRKHLVD